MRALTCYAIAALLFILWIGDKPQPHKNINIDLLRKAEQSANQIDAKLTSNRYQQGSVTATNNTLTLSERQINQKITEETNGFPSQMSALLYWPAKDGKPLSMSAPGIDHRHHWVNSFLVGVHPFEVENHWLPLYTIAQRKSYTGDDEQYKVREMWQNSAQAFVLPQGDCEDHAILLADWLISEGVDARVVGGMYETTGHAWVVAIVNGESFLLEATDKRAGKSWNHYPLAALATKYKPEFMFNRTDFWMNYDKSNQADYTANTWVKRSVFKKK